MNNCRAIHEYLELQAKTFTNDKLQLASKQKSCHYPAHRKREKEEENMKGRQIQRNPAGFQVQAEDE